MIDTILNIVVQIFTQLKSVGIFVIVLSILIVVHEWGHFITAKRLGVEVKEFSLGFGPKLYSKLYNGTEYMIKLIPLGGYVKMAGDERAHCTGSPEEFYSKPPGHRALIVLNGPVINYILAFFSLWIVFVIGYPELSSKLGEVIVDYPAYQAGLTAGDKILFINGAPIENWSDVQKNIAETSGSIEVVFLRDEVEMTKLITPKIERQKNIFGEIKDVPLLGIRPAEDIILLKYSVSKSFIKANEKLFEITTLTYKALYRMIFGKMSAKDSMTGPIGIFYIVKAASDMGFSHLLYIFAIISASLAIFNLLPIIPLDGGHLFLLAVEKVRGKAMSTKTDEIIAKIGFSLIICLALFVFYTDFDRFGWFDAIKRLWH